MATNVVPLFTDEQYKEYMLELFRVRDRALSVTENKRGRIFVGTDIPLRCVNLLSNRPKGVTCDMVYAYTAITRNQFRRWAKLHKNGELVNGMKVTKL